MDKHIKSLILRLDLRLNDAYNALHHFPERHLIHIQRHLSALDLGHIKNIIDQPEQVLA